MVNTADGYDYVTGYNIDAAHPHGDLDRIIIDGDIMPLRTGNTGNVDASGNPIPRANILRGEDIAFLMEWAMQRYNSLDAARYRNDDGDMKNVGVFKSSGEFTRQITRFRGASESIIVSYAPYYHFSKLANATKAKTSALRLYGSVAAGLTHSVVYSSSDSDIPDHIDVVCACIGDGVAFDIDGLTAPAHGDKLKKSVVLAYFAKAAAFADYGVRYSSITNISVPCEVIVTEWETSQGTPATPPTSLWGVYDYDGKAVYSFGTIETHYHCYGYPQSGNTLLELDAPHGDSVVAVCVFRVSSGVTSASNSALVAKTFSLTKKGTTFALTSNGFASSAFTESLISASGISVSNSSTRSASISLVAVYPVVYFDDHTRWTA